MPRLQDTAYPRLKNVMTARDLAAVFTPSSDEISVARRTARGAAAQLGFLVLLKLYQRLGRAMALADAPHLIVEHVAHAVGFLPTRLSSRHTTAQARNNGTWPQSATTSRYGRMVPRRGA